MNVRIPILAVPLVLAAATGAHAAEEWNWHFTPYAWAANLDVTAEVDDRTVVDRSIAVTDLIEDIDWTAQFHVDGRLGRSGLMFDIFDIRLSSEGDRVAIPTVPGASAVLDSHVDMTIFEAGGLWNPRGDGEGFAFLYGVRLFDQYESLDLRYEGVPGDPAPFGVADEETYVDALVGVRYVKRLSRRVTAALRADASAGGTELTWSTTGSLAVALGRTERYALVTGYRRMSIAFEEEDSVQTDMTLSGAFVGLRIAF